MIGKTSLPIAASLAALAIASPAAAKDCGELAGMMLDQGKVDSATLVAAGAFEPPASPFGPPPGVAKAAYAHLPAFCRVQATLTPTTDSDIKVEIWLPATGWNGKYVGLGNGIWAGQLSISEMGAPLSRGYAVATTDTGHKGTGLTGDFAVGHPEKFIDFGHRAVHVMTVTAKSAIREFYGKGPKLSFWNSCSTGGRQGLMEAYRHPGDYDAISAMAPANPMTDLMTQSMWASWVTKRLPGAGLTPAKLASVHQAVVRQCDKLDGLEDGLVGRPDACSFDPGTIICKAGDGDGCLSAPQAYAMRGIYDGVRGKQGELLLPGWPRGSELQMAMLVMGAEPFPVATSYFRQLVYGANQGWDWQAMDYTSDVQAARGFGADVLDVPASGLKPFFARGGKLLLSHGWSDGLIPANNTIAFHRALYSALPQASAETQLRLFMAPGMDHCSGGEGPSQIDTLAVLDAWATSGVAPDRVVASRGGPAMPGAPVLPPMSRPLCPFPLVAQYDGEGDTNAAENFSCKKPQ